MESIEMVQTPNFFEIKVNFDQTDKENAITKNKNIILLFLYK